jgi:glutamate formiminotransferase
MVDATLFESVPNFSEGRRLEVISAIARAGEVAHVLDTDSDADHHRAVITLAAPAQALIDALMGSIRAAIENIDMRSHSGVHPRVGAADVVPIVPMRGSLADAGELAGELGERLWTELHVPVYFYGAGAGKTLADIRGGRVPPDLGGPHHHPTAGAVCVGARPLLLAYNLLLPDLDLASALPLARSLRESAGGLRGVQALAFELPGRAVQLSMNLFRLEETGPAAVLAELERRGVRHGTQEVVGLCPASVALDAASGKLLEGRLAAAAAGAGARLSAKRGDDEHVRLATRLAREAQDLARLGVGQDDLLAGAERAAALIQVLMAGGLLDAELETMLDVAARGLRRALSESTASEHRARVDALDRRLV